MPPAPPRRAPQPIPYQGSKRRLAPALLACFPEGVDRLIEPFAGSAALSLAAAASGRARRFVLGDSFGPLVALWAEILERPEPLCAAYAALHAEGVLDPAGHYLRVRERFNRTRRPEDLLYLLARCVKGAVRFSAQGRFNQSADRRRLGARPEALRGRILGAHTLLTGRTALACGDYTALLDQATPADLVYLDPPYQGVSGARDARYFQTLDLDRLIGALEQANRRGLRYLLSFDGASGGRRYGGELPPGLGLRRVELAAGRSSQATLLGRVEHTVEALYLSPALEPAPPHPTHPAPAGLRTPG